MTRAKENPVRTYATLTPSARAKIVKSATSRVKTHAPIDFARSVRGR